MTIRMLREANSGASSALISFRRPHCRRPQPGGGGGGGEGGGGEEKQEIAEGCARGLHQRRRISPRR